MDFIQDWGLTAMVFAPLAGVALLWLFPREAEGTHKVLALLASLVSAGFGIAVLADFDYDRTGELQFTRADEWISVINARYAIGIDGLSVPLIALTLLIVPLVIAYSWNHWPEPRNPKAFLSLILVLHTGMLGSFVAQDLILFFVFFEVVLLPMYFMIGVWGGPERQYASIKFFLFTLFGSAFMILSFLALFFLTGAETFLMQPVEGLQGLNELVAASDIARTTQLVVFGGIFLGFGIKVPMFPFHTWLPDAHTQAPTQGSVILAAVLLKLGTYGFIRVALPILPEAAEEWAPWIGLLAVIGIIYGALGCLAQTDMKRLIAFSSVAHMGYVMLGISTLTDFGMNAAVFGMVAHGLITGMLFFVAGSVKERYHTLEISRLGGLLVSAPRLGWILGFVTMASLGLPGLAGVESAFFLLGREADAVLQLGRGDDREVPRLVVGARRRGAGGADGFLDHLARDRPVREHPAASPRRHLLAEHARPRGPLFVRKLRELRVGDGGDELHQRSSFVRGVPVVLTQQTPPPCSLCCMVPLPIAAQ